MDYRVKINIRNNRLLRAMEEKGYRSARQFCMGTGLNYSWLISLISGKIKPLRDNGTLSPHTIDLLSQLDLNLEDAFTERQLQGFKKHSFQMDMSESQMASISSLPTKNAELFLMEKDVSRVLSSIMAETLNPREEMIIRGFYFENKNTEDLAKEFSITRSRVDQIIKKGLFKISTHYKKLDQSGIKEVFPQVGNTPILERKGNSYNSRNVIRKIKVEKELRREQK